jgi:hypothetical protein
MLGIIFCHSLMVALFAASLVRGGGSTRLWVAMVGVDFVIQNPSWPIDFCRFTALRQSWLRYGTVHLQASRVRLDAYMVAALPSASRTLHEADLVQSLQQHWILGWTIEIVCRYRGT